MIFQNSPKYHEPPRRRVIFGEFWNITSQYLSQIPQRNRLFLVYTRQRNFALYVASVIFTCKYFKFGLNTTGLSQWHFRSLSACSIRAIIPRGTFHVNLPQHSFPTLSSVQPCTSRLHNKKRGYIQNYHHLAPTIEWTGGGGEEVRNFKNVVVHGEEG